MFLLVMVYFAGAMSVNKIDVIETHWSKASCVKRVKEAEKIGVPEGLNIGCIHVREIKKIEKVKTSKKT